MAGAAGLKLGADDFIDLLGIGFALGGLHDLAHKESQHLVFAAAQLIKLLWVGCNQIVDDLRQRAIVAHLSQVQGFDQFIYIGVCASFPQRIK